MIRMGTGHVTAVRQEVAAESGGGEPHGPVRHYLPGQLGQAAFPASDASAATIVDGGLEPSHGRRYSP